MLYLKSWNFGSVTKIKEKVFFLVLVYVFKFKLILTIFQFSAAIWRRVYSSAKYQVFNESPDTVTDAVKIFERYRIQYQDSVDLIP